MRRLADLVAGAVAGRALLALLATIPAVTPRLVRAQASGRPGDQAPVSLALPTPTGPHGVGSVDWLIVDSTRTDTFDAIVQPCRLMVSVWYPAARGARGPIAPTGNVPNDRVRAVLGEWGSEDSTMTAVTGAATNADRATIMRRYLTSIPVTTRSVARWTADSRLVLDRLARLGGRAGRREPGDPITALFADRLDTLRLGAVGHSFGGVAAAELCRVDARCRAALTAARRRPGSRTHRGADERRGARSRAIADPR